MRPTIHLALTCLAAAFLALATLACAREAPIEGAACNVDHRCPGGFSCAAGACRKLDASPIARCDEDRDCVIGVCLEAAGFCVQCEVDADCGQAACIDGAYVCGCRADDECSTGRCNQDNGVCVSCYAGEQCDSGICDVVQGRCSLIDGKEDEDEENAGGTR